MALNLVQHRERSERLGSAANAECDTERWVAAIAGGRVPLAGLRRRSTTGLLLVVGGGTLAWWAYTGR